MSEGSTTKTAYRTLPGRREPLDRISTIIRSSSNQAVYLIAGAGLGKSSLTEGLVERLSAELNVLRLHGSAALAAVPFGVLTPYTADLTAEESVSPVAVLRSMWSFFERLKAGNGAPVLLVVDDAHYLDDASAAVVADLIAAGWAKVVAAARPRPGLPQPLNQLWYDGLAERVDLRLLNREQIEEELHQILDGTIPAATVDAVWTASGGNPRILDALLHDAAAAGVLARRNGTWVLLAELPFDGERITAVVAKDHLRRAPEEQEAVKLIALAGPVSRKAIEEICGAGVVRALLEQQTVVEQPTVPAELTLWNGLLASAIRSTVSVSRSLQLLEKTRPHLDVESLRGEGLGRYVEWSLDCGLPVADAHLMAAAGEALEQFTNASARRIAAKVQDPALVPAAQAIQARALFNQGRYAAAAALLDACWPNMSQDADGAAVLLLRAAAYQATGQPMDELVADVVERTTTDTGWPLDLLRLIRLGGELNAPALALEVEQLGTGTDDDAGRPLPALAGALLAHALCTAGKASQGVEAAMMAATELRALKGSLYYYPQVVLGRLVIGYLAMGEWESAEREINSYAGDLRRGHAVFDGSLQVLRGYALLRQGRLERAYQILVPAVEALRLNDPAQLFKFGAALGRHAAVRLGYTAQAKRLESDYRDAATWAPAHDLHARAHNAAATEFASAGAGLAELHSYAELARAGGRVGTQLELLAMCWDLGDQTVVPAIRTVAANVEGRWAAGLLSLAEAWDADDADTLLSVAASLEKGGFVNLARDAYGRAGARFEAAGERRRARQAVTHRERCELELGERYREGKFIAAAPAVHLTRREQDIVGLAVTGMTDREIAQHLMVSVRTVEGHLYRTYVKLGVRSREELESVFPQH